MTRTLVARARGRVQGVGFRYFVVERAGALELVGWVRNTADGGVEVEAQGPDDKLAELERDLAEGPRMAHVSGVDVAYIERPAYDGFDVRW